MGQAMGQATVPEMALGLATALETVPVMGLGRALVIDAHVQMALRQAEGEPMGVTLASRSGQPLEMSFKRKSTTQTCRLMACI